MTTVASSILQRAGETLLNMEYLLDTCIFNWILDGRYSLEDLPKGGYSITHIQQDEINAEVRESRKESPLGIFQLTGSVYVPTGVFAVGVSRVGQAAVGNDAVYAKIYAQLCALDPQKRKHKSHIKDAIVGATAHARKIGLVTADRNFYKAIQGFLPEHQLVLWSPKLSTAP